MTDEKRTIPGYRPWRHGFWIPVHHNPGTQRGYMLGKKRKVSVERKRGKK